MFGTYAAPFEIEQEGIKISLAQKGNGYFYQRMCHDEKEEKVLLADSPTILINPVEPVNKPKTLCPHRAEQTSYGGTEGFKGGVSYLPG